jgi:hypothetical protein
VINWMLEEEDVDEVACPLNDILEDMGRSLVDWLRGDGRKVGASTVRKDYDIFGFGLGFTQPAWPLREAPRKSCTSAGSQTTVLENRRSDLISGGFEPLSWTSWYNG